MAVNDVFFVAGAPYVHSDISHFYDNVGQVNSIKKSSEVNQIINKLTQIRNNLEIDANNFLQGQDYREVSKQLFVTPSFQTVALSVVRDIEFTNEVLHLIKFDYENQAFKDFMREMGLEITVEIQKSSNFKEATNKIIKDYFKKYDKNQGQIQLGKTGFSKLFEGQEEITRNVITNSTAFRKDVNTLLKRLFSNTPELQEEIWKAFVKRFEERINKTIINLNGKEEFLKEFKDLFIKALKNSEIFDLSNITGWLGEDFKNALWKVGNKNGCSVQFDFINVGNLSEKTLKEKVKDEWQSDIESLNIGQEGTKSHSDWVFRNSNGYIVRAQDKNSSQYLQALKKGENYPQILKLHDEILYTSLMEKLQEYNDSMVPDRGYMDYLVANTAWFSKHKSSAKSNITSSIGDLQSIRELINQYFTQGISYFVGADANIGFKDTINFGVGRSNTFFVIDNLILFPTYLMVDYIIKQLQQVQDQLIKLQVTLNINSMKITEGGTSTFLKKKKNNLAATWKKGEEYGENVLQIGQAQGKSIITSLKISRINLRFDLKNILQSAYNLKLEDI